MKFPDRLSPILPGVTPRALRSAVLGALLIGWPARTADWRPAPAGDEIGFLITEVLFAPRPGDTGFVELTNVGLKPLDLTALILRVDTVELPLPRLERPVPKGGRALIRFGGQGTVEGLTAYAQVTLPPAGGALSLERNDRHVLDRFTWGTGGGMVPVSEGLRPFEPGSSVGRVPGATTGSAEWIIYPPAQVTPGGPNSLPAVEQLLPMSGAIIDGPTAELAWYPSPGAARYRVQLGSDTGFIRPTSEQVVTAPGATLTGLTPGVYWWRVQGLGAEDGARAGWSPPARLEIGTPSPDDPPGIGWGLGAPAKLIAMQYLTQHKDTRMLVLELPRQKGWHPWDADHVSPSWGDPADSKNCAAANVAMINRFFGGDLSQDRIGYEVLSRNILKYAPAISAGVASAILADPRFSGQAAAQLREVEPGPERDLIYGQGLGTLRTYAAFMFALGAEPDLVPQYPTRDSVWLDVTSEIDAGRPLVGANWHHAFVIRGYQLRGGRRILYVYDPANGRYSIDLDASALPPDQLTIFKFPNHPRVARQEPGVTTDSDGDGVVDFDERERFRINPSSPDSDQDGVKDKEDIVSGVFEREFGMGYAYTHVSDVRDFDADGMATERDPDSDNGGCRDGEEDRDADGFHGGSESGNFVTSDDICENLDGSISFERHFTNDSPEQIIREGFNKGTIQVRLKPDLSSSDPGHYVDNGSTFSYQSYNRIEIANGNCTIWGIQSGRGGGLFNGPEADIGGYRSDLGELVIGGEAPITATGTTGSCLGGGSGPMASGISVPDCTGRLVTGAAAARWARRNRPAKVYIFDCPTAPTLPGPGWTILKWYTRGWVRVQ